MKRKFRLQLIIGLVLALVVTSGLYAFTYTTTTATVDVAVAGEAIVTHVDAATQPDWDSILTPPTTDIETLRPTAAGDETNISSQNPATGAHWDKVDETTSDDDSTYVYTSSSGWEEDLYNIADHSAGSGTITSVKVYMVCRADASPTQTSTYVHIKTGGTEYNGSQETVTTSYATYSYQWNTNPQTLDDWTWDEIDALQIGVGLRQPTSGQETRCTQVYVEVSYGNPALLGEVPAGDLFDITPDAEYSGGATATVYLTNTGDLVKAYDYLNMKVYIYGSVEAEETPNYQLLTLQNGEVNFTRADIAPTLGTWTQTSQSDFQGGTLNQVEATTSSGNVLLDTFSDTVTDTFDDETKIYSKTNLVVAGGQVKLTSGGAGATETLRPDGVGDETNIDLQEPLSGAHWDKVDDVTSDSDSTYVGTEWFEWQEDLYNIADHSTGSGNINYVRVYAVAKAEIVNKEVTNLYLHIKTNGVEDNGPEAQISTSYLPYSYQWNTNPQTGNPWTWDEIDALQIGVGLRRPKPGNYTRVTQVYAEVNYTAYDSPGTLTSVNLLSGETVVSIDSFDYNASAIPSGTGLKVQFSQDSTNWYNSSGTPDGWDTLSQGANNIDLSGLGWSGDNFYYKMEFTSDGTDTPVLDEISVNFSTYYASGDLTSSAYDTEYDVEWSTISFTIVEPSATDIQFQIRTAATEGGLSAATWYGPTGTGDYYTTSGTNINPVHDGDRWIQYKAYFSGPSDDTPTLSDVSISYSGTPITFVMEVIGGSYCLVSTDTSGWEAGWTVTPEFYCHIVQR